MLPPGFTLAPPHATSSDRTPWQSTPAPLKMDATTDNQQAETTVETSATDALTRKLLASTHGNNVTAQAPGISWTSHTQYAKFNGLFIVQSPTESRHVSYAMDLACEELHLFLRCIQRFSSFHLLRKRLLLSLKHCHTQLESASHSVVGLIKEPCCGGCRQMRKELKRVPFPKRALLFTTADDVDARVPRLELFLDECIKLVADWRGCARGRKGAALVLGKFLSFDLLGHLQEQASSAAHREKVQSSEGCQSIGGGAESVFKTADVAQPEAATSNQVEAM